MRRLSIWGLCSVAWVLGVGVAMGTEEAKFTVVERDGRVEIRDYDRQLVVETVVGGTLEDAGNMAFRKLFRFISGENRQRRSIAMTAPVSQEPRGESIAMTAPVTQAEAKGGWAVGFMMPSSYTLQTLPVPVDPDLTVREIPARRVAAIRYSGTWSEARYRKHLTLLEAWLRDRGWVSQGSPVWARYNPPFTPWFLRRNEILIPVAKAKDGAS